jgi:mono/diheme cytochrome c family protein
MKRFPTRGARTFLSLAIPSALAIACSSAATPTDYGPAPTPSETSNANADAGADVIPTFPSLHVLPAQTHSGFDGTHAFKVPVAVYGGSGVKLVASDPSMVDIAPTKLVDPTGDSGDYFMVTTKKAGTVTLTAIAGASSASATLSISAYTLDEYSVGEHRYTTAATSGPACVSCHSANGGIDHSPSRLASAKDTDVVTVITTGILVEGSPITAVRHKWAVSDTEAAGLVAYLRALEPRGFTQ